MVDISANFFKFGRKVSNFSLNLCIDKFKVAHSFQIKFLFVTGIY